MTSFLKATFSPQRNILLCCVCFYKLFNSRRLRCQNAVLPVRHLPGKCFLNLKPWQLCGNPATEESLQTQQMVGTGSDGDWVFKKIKNKTNKQKTQGLSHNNRTNQKHKRKKPHSHKTPRKCTKGHSSPGCAITNLIHSHRMQLLRNRRQKCIHTNAPI